MIFLKRTLPLIITFITGMIMIVAFFSGEGLPSIKSLESTLPKWIQIIMTFTMVLGAFSLLRINLQKISRKADGWGYSLVLIIGFLSMAFLGLITGSWPMFDKPLTKGEIYYVLCEDNVSARPIRVIDNVKDKEGKIKVEYVDDKGEKLADTESAMIPPDTARTRIMSYANSMQQILFVGVFKNAQSTMFSLLAFFVASASFRAFRIKSKEAGLLMGSAFIVMLGNVSIGSLVSQILAYIPVIGPYLNIADIKEWIMTYPSSAAQSAILIGAMLGYISASMKIIFGVERSHLGGEG
ncbi:MAG: hypothetical protein BWY02_01914 [bacterium ADurb.Bin157]|jgi:hypothetical protein|nr:MAG: hypothetical protein BWY02_01914 [bacterium ADurb.Bin157]